MTEKLKKCYRCKKEKHVIFFCKDKARADGLSGRCRQCSKENYEMSKKIQYTPAEFNFLFGAKNG